MRTTIRIDGWTAAAAQRLTGAEQPRLEAHLLLSHALQKPRSWLLAHPETELTSSQQAQLNGLLDRLCAGEPLPYLLGQWEFYGQSFEVSPAVLIPRPETEQMVEEGLCWLRQHPGARRAADVGTGSGCIAASLALHTAGLFCLAVDRSGAALQVARRNFLRHGVPVEPLCGDLLEAVAGPLDLVCANLPYIPHSSLTALPVARHEPLQALDGGPDGLDLIRRLLVDAPRWLAQPGLLLLEMQIDQGEAVQSLAREVFPAAAVSQLNDLAGLPRIVRIER